MARRHEAAVVIVSNEVAHFTSTRVKERFLARIGREPYHVGDFYHMDYRLAFQRPGMAVLVPPRQARGRSRDQARTVSIRPASDKLSRNPITSRRQTSGGTSKFARTSSQIAATERGSSSLSQT